MRKEDVIKFWYQDAGPEKWFLKDKDFDAEITKKFHKLHAAASRCELFSWRSSAEGRLAEIIVLDQFSRNIYRDKPTAFASDPLALALSQEAIAAKVDQQITPEQRGFMYLPLMHSESKIIHEFAVGVFADFGNAEMIKYAHLHKVIIDRFGRYPHRNVSLGRKSSQEEIDFLSEPNSSF